MERHGPSRLPPELDRIEALIGVRWAVDQMASWTSFRVGNPNTSSSATILRMTTIIGIAGSTRRDSYNSALLPVSRAGSAFDASGGILDEATRENVRKFVGGFVDHASARKV